MKYKGMRLRSPSGANEIEILFFSADDAAMKVRNKNGTETWMSASTDLSAWTEIRGADGGQPPPLPDGEVRVTDSKTGGQKGKKPEAYALIPAAPLAELARLYGAGAEKYDAWNWLKGYDWSLSYSALGRHVEKHRGRIERTDRETRCHHLICGVFHLFTLYEFERLGLGTDDRQPLTGAQPTEELPE